MACARCMITAYVLCLVLDHGQCRVTDPELTWFSIGQRVPLKQPNFLTR